MSVIASRATLLSPGDSAIRPEDDESFSDNEAINSANTNMNMAADENNNNIIGKLKRSRRERHYKALDSYEKLLDHVSEERENEVLQLVLKIRDELEGSDKTLSSTYTNLMSYDYLIIREESDLYRLLDDIRAMMSQRCAVIEKLALGLESIECNRADVISSELKKLVDTLVSIAHQLPNEIEHIIEDEAHDLNAIIIQNRLYHEELLNLLQKQHLEVDIESEQRWEDGRKLWRQIRHDKALKDYDVDIHSASYFDPISRKKCLYEMQQGSSQRQQSRQDLIKELSSMSVDAMKSTDIIIIKEKLQQISDLDIEAIQECYDSLQDLRKDLQATAEQRTEALRRELHLYGALSSEPDRHAIINIYDTACHDDHLQELWRQSGGLKPDIMSIMHDIDSDDIVYDKHVDHIIDRLDIIHCGFQLRAMMVDRGRGAMVDRMRNHIAKLRILPHEELNTYIMTFITELEDMMTYVDATSSTSNMIFTRQHAMIINEMHAALNKAKEEKEAVDQVISSSTSYLSSTLLKASSNKQKASLNKSGSRLLSSSRRDEIKAKAIGLLDLNQVKSWYKRLGVLYYSCDLPSYMMDNVISSISAMKQQKLCNHHIDDVIHHHAYHVLHRIENEYKHIIDNISHHLEAQTSTLSIISMNICHFILSLSHRLERHQIQHHSIDEHVKDMLWDHKEDYRLLCDDHDAAYLRACQALRSSVDDVQLHHRFEEVLMILDDIKSHYHLYYDKICYTIDVYPVQIIDEYMAMMTDMMMILLMKPVDDHPVIISSAKIYEDMIRLNKRYIDANADVLTDIRHDAHHHHHDRINALEIYTSPLISSSVSSSPVSSCGLAGRYHQLYNIHDIMMKFRQDRGYDIDSSADDDVSSPVSSSASSSSSSCMGRDDYPFLKQGSYVIPKSNDDVMMMHDDDAMYVYNEAISDALIIIPDIDALIKNNQVLIDAHNATMNINSKISNKTPSSSSSSSKVTKNDKSVIQVPTETHPSSLSSHIIWTSDDKMISKYRELVSYVTTYKAKEAERLHARHHISPYDISSDDILSIYTSTRDHIIMYIEQQASSHLSSCIMITQERKHEYSEELADRIRLHWPKRGRIETEIKQPRLGEIKNHQEKTYRYIQSIQQRMVDSQAMLHHHIASYQQHKHDYIHDIRIYHEMLHNPVSSYKNLASLQAVDVKARGRMTAYHQQRIHDQQLLHDIISHDPINIITYAHDFKKICPIQVLGDSIDSLADNLASGGYSIAELDMIDSLIAQQCHDVEEVVVEWKQQVDDIIAKDDECDIIYDAFMKDYEVCAHELAMSEGLGQKYGAPRRRAQERIRTELSRDEMNVNTIDMMIDEVDAMIHAYTSSSSSSSSSSYKPNAREKMDMMMFIWKRLSGLREAFDSRLRYLQVHATASTTALVSLSWIQDDLIPSNASSSYDDKHHVISSTMNIYEVVDDMERSCRQETKDLYTGDGKSAVVIPASLEQWLAENRMKILGIAGYHERAWKKLWQQIQRYDRMIMRRLPADDHESCHHPATVICMRSMYDAYIQHIHDLVQHEDNRFDDEVRQYQPMREHHERQLRPRLGSEGAVDELNLLNEQEATRSSKYIESIISYRYNMMDFIINESKRFVDDVGVAMISMFMLVDTSVRQESIKLPPDTIIPKKRLTAKRMRKAQRLSEMIAQAQSQPPASSAKNTNIIINSSNSISSRERVWPAMHVSNLLNSMILASNMMIVAASESNDVIDSNTSSSTSHTKMSKVSSSSNNATMKGLMSPKPAPAGVTATAKEKLAAWSDEVTSKSSIRSGVSTAHRAIIKERDVMLERFSMMVEEHVSLIKSRCDRLIASEESWKDRWQRQVNLLRQGSMW